jgi:putative transposase
MMINSETHYLWWAVDDEGDVLERFVAKGWDGTLCSRPSLRHRQATFLRNGDTIYWQCRQSVNRPLPQHSSRDFTPAIQTKRAGHASIYADASIQKFGVFHTSAHTHANAERHLHSRSNFKLNRAAALAGWRDLSAT